MRLLLDTYSSDENWNGDCDYGFLTVTDTDAAELLHYMDTCARVKEMFGESMYAVELWDYRVEYIEYHDALEDLGILDGERVTIIPDSFTPADDTCQRTESDTLVIMPDSVHWTANPKYTGVLIETPALGRQFLEEIADGRR